MNNNPPLPLGSKIKQIREASGYSQEQVARYAKIQRSKLSDLEMGKIEFDQKTLLAVRKFLEIEDAPLLEHEMELFMTRMEVWDGTLDANRVESAREMANDLAPILHLPYEYDLLFLYAVLDARTLIKEGNIAAAKERIDASESLLGKASNKHICLYHQTKGVLYTCFNDYKPALHHYQQALDIMGNTKSKVRLLGNIGIAYYNLGKIYHAITALERASEEFSGDKTNPLGSNIKGFLAMCLMRIGEYDKSKKLFDEILSHSRSINDKNTITNHLINRGFLSNITGNYAESLEFFVQAYAIAVDTNHFTPLLQVYGAAGEAYALRKLKKLDQCKETIAQAKPYAKDNELFTVLLGVQENLINLNDPKCIGYLEDVAIPFLRTQGGIFNFNAVDICKELVAYYAKKKTKTKVAAIKAIMCDIYEEVFLI